VLPRLCTPFSLIDLISSTVGGTKDERERFEAAFAALFEFPYAIFFPYGRSALFALLQALSWREREVLCPAYTCAVVPHAIHLSGNRVRFVDSSETHFLVPREQWTSRTTSATAMVIHTPLFGYPVDRADGGRLPNRTPFVLYDVAQGFGVSDEAGLQTSGADAALFSLGIGKVISTLYGGMLALRDAALHQELRRWRDQNYKSRGIGRSLALAAYGTAAWSAFREPMLSIVDRLERRSGLLDKFTTYFYATDRPRLPEDVATLPTRLQARLGLGQLNRYHALVAERQRISSWYDERLGTEGFQPFSFRALPNWSIYPLAVADRGAVVTWMRNRGVQLGILNGYCCADLPGYETHAGSCPNATRWAGNIINLPNWPGLGQRRARRVLDALLSCRDAMPQAISLEASHGQTPLPSPALPRSLAQLPQRMIVGK
jgi:dTDP-4-amino-4,6-dideoxygalactose transaminase